jgi:hypothetical protein
VTPPAGTAGDRDEDARQTRARSASVGGSDVLIPERLSWPAHRRVGPNRPNRNRPRRTLPAPLLIDSKQSSPRVRFDAERWLDRGVCHRHPHGPRPSAPSRKWH